MAVLDLEASMQMLQKHRLPLARAVTVKTAAGLQKVKRIPFPWVMKAVSKKVSHKTEHGGVILGVKDLPAAKKAFARLKKLPGFSGALVQEQARGFEVLVGGKRDAQFGPVVLCGMGGIYTEVLKDTSLRILPLDKGMAKEMLHELKGYPLLSGARGQEKINQRALVSVIEKVARLMKKEERVQELDLNPVMCSSKGAVCVDARAVVA